MSSESRLSRLLGALTVLFVILGAVVGGAVPAAAQNAVGASTLVMINSVGSSTDIGAGQRLGKTVLQPGFVVATGVAAETADAAATSVGKEVTTYYPTNRGFFGASTKQTLATGTRIDRYGGEGGFFASPEGTPAAMRALRPGTDLTNLHAYEVVSPLEVDAGTVAPWFGQLGLGTQYELPASVADLLDSGLLKAVE
jgi:hypothetical protein